MHKRKQENSPKKNKEKRSTLRWIQQKKCPCNFKKARDHLLSEERNSEASRYPWLFDNELCPRQAKDEALFEFISSVHSSKRSLEEKNIKKPPIDCNPEYQGSPIRRSKTLNLNKFLKEIGIQRKRRKGHLLKPF
jgi:hypothetical protein